MAASKKRALLLAAAILLLAAGPVRASILDSADSVRGHDLYDRGLFPQARATLEAAHARNSADPAVTFWLARTCEMLGDYDRAQGLFVKVMAVPAPSPQAGVWLEQIARSLGENLDRARALVAQARRCYGDPKLFPKAGGLLAAAGLLAPQHWEVWAEKGRLAYLRKSWEEAVNCYRNAVRFRPDRPECSGLLALALFRKSGTDKAMLDESFRAAERAVALRGSDPRAAADDAVDLDLMGTIRYNQGRFDEAARLFRTAVEKAPGADAYQDHLVLAEDRVNRQ